MSSGNGITDTEKGDSTMKRMIVVLAVFIALVIGTATSYGGIGIGTREVSAFGALTRTSYGSFDDTDLTIGLTANYFVTDVVSIGATVIGSMYKPDGGDTSAAIYYLGRSDYYFVSPGQDLIPYVGGRLGFISFESGGDSEVEFVYGFQGGGKLFLQENTSLNGELSYTRFEVRNTSTDVIQFTIGFSLYFQ